LFLDHRFDSQLFVRCANCDVVGFSAIDFYGIASRDTVIVLQIHSDAVEQIADL